MTSSTVSKLAQKERVLQNARKKFKKLLPELLTKYEGKYAAVADDYVEIHDDKYQLFDLVTKKYGYHTFFMSRIQKQQKTIQLRSPRLKHD